MDASSLTRIEVHYDCGIDAASTHLALFGSDVNVKKDGKTITVIIHPGKVKDIYPFLLESGIPAE